MTDLPVPPNVPESVATAIIDNFNLVNGEDEFRCGEYFTACVYEHLWREESTRHSDLAAGHEYAKCCRAINQCAERARELNHG